jgi:hypothetical protein
MKRIGHAGAAAFGLVAVLVVAAGAAAAPPHEHGVARVDIATEPKRVTVLMEMPLDNLLGFEREPRTDDERKAAELAITRLRTPGALFRIDPAAGCVPGKIDLQSAALGLGAVGGAKDGPKEGHADVDASYDFVCKDGNRAGFLEVGLFDFFPRVQRVEVQAATRKGQLKATLVRPTTRVPLAR